MLQNSLLFRDKAVTEVKSTNWKKESIYKSKDLKKLKVKIIIKIKLK
jgi:hypothetical protein